MRMATPLILFAVMALTFVIRHYLGKRFARLAVKGHKSLSRRIFALFSFLVIALYTFSVSSVFAPFNCQKQPDGSRTIAKYAAIKCFEGAWMRKIGTITVFVFIYVFLIPLYLVVLFYWNRKDLEKFAAVFPNLISPYRREYFYWELVLMLRKAMFVVLSDFMTLSTSYLTRFFVSIGLLCVFFWLDVSFSPYRNDELNLLQSR
jgi:hypothetical protein